jgi:Xaa-Pro aminopeptidase
VGYQLDALAREPLWQQGWVCRHAIGHGVGHFLNVHEGPQRFSQDNAVPIEPGMVTTNEPGVYFEGRFGVRIESVVIAAAEESTEFEEFCGFETVTQCPIDLDLVDVQLLSREERTWLNEYHQRVYETLAPFLSHEEQQWLQHETRRV